MPLFHTCVNKDTHHFMGVQTLVLSGSPEDVQNQLNDFMTSPDNGSTVIYDVTSTTGHNTLTVIVLYGTFSRKRENYVSNYNQNRFNSNDGRNFEHNHARTRSY